jgi:hypothetical protein
MFSFSERAAIRRLREPPSESFLTRRLRRLRRAALRGSEGASPDAPMFFLFGGRVGLFFCPIVLPSRYPVILPSLLPQFRLQQRIALSKVFDLFAQGGHLDGVVKANQVEEQDAEQKDSRCR